MPQSFSRILLHIIFSTKDRQKLITMKLEKDLYAFLFGIMKKVNCHAIEINGMEQHIHILCDFPRTITVGNLIKEIKTSSTKWLKSKGGLLEKFHWQIGYSAFSVSQSAEKSVRTYIQRQKEHHKKFSFEFEYRGLLKKYNVPFDERYMWD